MHDKDKPMLCFCALTSHDRCCAMSCCRRRCAWCCPPMSNYAISLLKDTSVASLISAPELMLRARDLSSEYFMQCRSIWSSAPCISAWHTRSRAWCGCSDDTTHGQAAVEGRQHDRQGRCGGYRSRGAGCQHRLPSCKGGTQRGIGGSSGNRLADLAACRGVQRTASA